MASERMLILKWHKQTENTPWVVTMESESGLVFEIGVGEGAKTPAGPYLEETFMFMEKQISTYPFHYSMQHISDAKGREIRVKMLNEFPVFADVNTYTSQVILKYLNVSNYQEIQEKVFLQAGSEIIRPPAATSQMRTRRINSLQRDYTEKIEIDAEHVNDQHKYWLIMETSSASNPTGGALQGTISGFIWPEGEKVPGKVGKVDLTDLQKSIQIDYLGINAFSLTEKENEDRAKWYSTTPKVLTRVAEEAKNYNTNLLSGNVMLAVSLQYDSAMNKLVTSRRGNLLGVVYKTEYSDYDSIASAISSGHFTGVNINKALLRESYSQNSYLNKTSPSTLHLPLVEFTGYEDQLGLGLNLSNWARELSLPKPPNEDSYKESSGIKKEGVLEGEQEKVQEAVNKDKKKSNTREDTFPKEFLNNDLSFVEPLDDRLESGELYHKAAEYQTDKDGSINIQKDMPYDYVNKVRIGDVIMEVPPTSIRMDKQFQNEKVQGMRSKTSLQKQVGQTRNVLTMELYFHDLENINGRKVSAFVRSNGEEVFYYMDGLRSLLAQFKKTPFVPIDNEYINERLGIHNVALRAISTQTVEGFPEALSATLTLEEVDTSAYLMGESQLGALINYPLMRWHYQGLLHEPSTYQPWKTYLPTIDHLDNRFSFSIVNRTALDGRATALQKFRRMSIPRDYEAKLLDVEKEDTALNRQDGLEAKVAHEQYNNFLKVYNSGFSDQKKNIHIPKDIKKTYKDPSNVPVVAGEAIGYDVFDYYLSKNSFSRKDTEIGQSIGKYLYGVDDNDKRISKKVPFLGSSVLRHGVDALTSTFYPWNAITSGMSIKESVIPHITKYMNDNKAPGVFQLILRDQDKISEFEKQFKNYITGPTGIMGPEGNPAIYKEEVSGEFLKGLAKGAGMNLPANTKKGMIYIFPAVDTKELPLLTFVKKLVSTGKEHEEEVEEYTYEYNLLAAKINQSEEGLPMDKLHISDLVPINMQVTLENNFSMVQPRSAETPAMQFFGAQEPKVYLTFETGEQGIESLERMFRTVADYAKSYRDGIVSGFMGISNPLLNLFGIQSVLPDTIQYDTVPNHPGRFLVSLSFNAFDKSQRRQEALYGYTGGAENKELVDLAYDNYDPKVDSLYINEKMRQMELYPDMEMAKVSELNEDLKVMHAGLDKWENRTDQVYLDPDFYVSTSFTYRKFLNDLIADPSELVSRFEDGTGIKALSDLSANDPLVMNEEDEAEFEKQAGESTYNDPETNWEGFYDINSDGEAASSDKEKEEDNDQKGITPSADELLGSLSDKEKKELKEKAKKQPTFKEWSSWNPGKSKADYDKFLKSPTASYKDKDVWFYLADAVRKEFPSLRYAKGELQALEDRKNTSNAYLTSYYVNRAKNFETSLFALSWSKPEDFYVYQHKKRTEWSQNKLKNGIHDQLMSQGSRDMFEDIMNVSTKMTFMRVFTSMKAIMSQQSAWQQFDSSGKPYVSKTDDGLPARVGIMGYNLAKAKDASERHRLMWDWKYNIDKSVQAMAKVYKDADKSKYFEIRARKLDWAIASHSGNKLPKIVSSNNKKDDEPFGEKNQPIAPEAYSFYNETINAWTAETMLVTDTFAQVIYTNGNKEPIDEIFKIYNGKHAEMVNQTNNSSFVNGNLNTEEEALDYLKTQELESIAEKMVHNIEDWTPEKKVRNMFTDMIQYEHTGRLLRAFPSFSLQLIDEGKWYGNFRTWDNFYGYNALNSIDVYKSRKIAADTLTVEMSNMYGGLSGMRTDMRHPDLMMPSFFSSHFWEHYVFGKPTEEILEERREIYESILLQPGARVHLRMGYGSDSRHLPIVFNGTITELDAQEVVTFVAQGDGLELTNAISGSPDDENKRLFQVIEPSQYIGELMTTKGNWLQNFINNKSEGLFFKENPLGIAHFGSVITAESGNYNPFSNDFGESTQNVYSQNGQMTKEQWMDEQGNDVGVVKMYLEPLVKGLTGTGSFSSNYDEDNIGMKIYGATPWEVIQTFALASADYIAAAFPFEMRSSLFFGKPHWPVAYRYDSEYIYDEVTEKMRRQITYTHQKTFMQAHVYSTQFNILSNDIIASDEGIFNNVIVSYDGRTVGPMQADSDIRLDRQKTAHVEANIISKSLGFGYFGTNYWTAEAQAQKYGHSTVRDFMKDMYKGSYTVLGDSTLKPYDLCYMSDDVVDMEGIHLVKAVHHSMNGEDGFITTIEPDAYIINWDAELLFIPDKVQQVAKNTVLRAVGTSISLGGGFTTSIVVSKMASNIYQATGKLFAKIPDEIKDGVTRKVIANSYSLFGKAMDNSAIISTSEALKAAKTKDTAIQLMETLSSQRNSAMKVAEKTINQNALITEKGVTAAADKLAAISSKSLGIDDAKLAKELGEATKGLKEAEKLYKAAKGKKTALSAGKTVTTSIKNVSARAKLLLQSKLLWTFVITVGFEILTSGLVEAWKRKKQNAECIKVIPLQYKGQSWTAGMNGHRGSVKGDDPSLADDLMNARFGDGNEKVDDVWWNFVPKIINFVEDTNRIESYQPVQFSEEEEE